jgi:hypothetical protein
MDAARQPTHSGLLLAAIGAILLIALPCLLLAVAWLEATLFGTANVMSVYKVIGIRGAIQALYEFLAGV